MAMEVILKQDVDHLGLRCEVFTDVVAELKVVVAPEGQELPPEKELVELEARERAEAEAAEAEAAAEHEAAEAVIEEVVAEEEAFAEEPAAEAEVEVVAEE